MTAANDLVGKAIELLASYVEHRETSTLRQLAPVIVDLRASCSLEDGRTDWSGRSPEYRRAMRDVYNQSGLPRGQEDTIQAALRYHVGNLLRERVSAEELEDSGLIPLSPKQRLDLQRQKRPALASALNAVLDLHTVQEGVCRECGAGPCPTVVAIEAVLDGREVAA